MFRFGDTTVQSLGVAAVYFYASDGKRILYESDVINLDVAALIGLSLLFAFESDILLKEKKLVSPHWSVYLVFKQGHLFIEPRSSNQVMYPKHALATFLRSWDILMPNLQNDSCLWQSIIQSQSRIRNSSRKS
jgi:hypothetical protein